MYRSSLVQMVQKKTVRAKEERESHARMQGKEKERELLQHHQGKRLRRE